ncbi:ribosome-associated translation inhibitor RaiA [Candidatus Kaiserbacteria bacterium]|nr:ribosome-associated translation inhibitor RaiA [Candidatus Kaiserbacteria bacterium]
MTFPTIQYKFNDLNEVRALTDVVEQKLEVLHKYFRGAEPSICDVEFSKSAPHKNGEVHKVEINLVLDGTMYRAEASEASFEKAIDEVRDELDKELRRAKEKQVTLEKQAGREVKEKMISA